MLDLVQHFFQNPSFSSNPGRPSQNLFSQRRLTEESRCPSDHLERPEGFLYCLFLFRRAILKHTQSVILTSLDFAILIGIDSYADGMLRSRILVNQQNNSLDRILELEQVNFKRLSNKPASGVNHIPRLASRISCFRSFSILIRNSSIASAPISVSSIRDSISAMSILGTMRSSARSHSS